MKTGRNNTNVLISTNTVGNFCLRDYLGAPKLAVMKILVNSFYAFIFICLLALISCNDITDKPIRRDTMEKDVEAIKKSLKGSDKDSIKINILDQLVSVSKDLDFYVQREKEMNDGKFSWTDYLVDKETFKSRTDKFFDALSEKKYTYKQLLKEIDEINKIKGNYYKELEPIYKEIDSVCKTCQNKVDAMQTDAESIKDSLNKMVELKLISIEKTEVDYLDAIAVRIKMTNKTEKPVEAISFAVDLVDKLGNKVVTLGCKSNDGFDKSDVGLWTYSKYDRNEIYDKLENVRASHVTMSQKIKKINLGGQILGLDTDNIDLGENFEYYVDLKYKTPKKLNGYCGYLKDKNPYNEEAEKIEKRRDEEIKKGDFPIVKLWTELSVYDFDKRKPID